MFSLPARSKRYSPNGRVSFKKCSLEATIVTIVVGRVPMSVPVYHSLLHLVLFILRITIKVCPHTVSIVMVLTGFYVQYLAHCIAPEIILLIINIF